MSVRASGRLRRMVAVLAAVVSVVGLAAVGLSSRAAVAHADASTGSGGLFVPVQGRILDTRPAFGTGGYTTPMPAGVWRTVQVTGQAGIPSSGVAAVAVNFTVLNDPADGYLNADKDEATPNATVGYLHWTGGVGQTNSGVVAVADDGKIQVKATTATDLLIDVQGYYTAADPAGAIAPGGFVPVTQRRLVDTRNGTGLPDAPLAGGTTVTIPVAGLVGVPADASAVMFDFLVVNPPVAGFITPYPADQAQPTQSLNFGNSGGSDTTTAAIGLAAGGANRGAINLHVGLSTGTIDLAIDVLGYFTATDPTSGSGGAFTPAAARVYDSRDTGNTPLTGAEDRVIPVAGVAGVPATGVAAVAVNIVVFDYTGTDPGFLRAWPDGTTEEPADLAVQYPAASWASNMLTLALGTDGAIHIHNMTTTDTINIAILIEGWYTPLAPLDAGDVMSNASGSTTPTLFAVEGSLTDDSTGESAAGLASTGDPLLKLPDDAAGDDALPATDGSPDVVYGSDDRTRVTNTADYPWRAYVAINSSVGRCSGSLVAPNVVVTTGHCVISKDGIWATGMKIWPGRDGRSTPYGVCGDKTLYVPRGWSDYRMRAFDWAVIKLDCSIGNRVGWFGYESSGSASGAIAGYPGNKTPVWSMWVAYGSWTAHNLIMEYQIDTSAGQSGAPLTFSGCVTYCVVAVHGGTQAGYNIAARICTGNNSLQTINKVRNE